MGRDDLKLCPIRGLRWSVTPKIGEVVVLEDEHFARLAVVYRSTLRMTQNLAEDAADNWEAIAALLSAETEIIRAARATGALEKFEEQLRWSDGLADRICLD